MFRTGYDHALPASVGGGAGPAPVGGGAAPMSVDSGGRFWANAFDAINEKDSNAGCQRHAQESEL